MEQFDSLTIHKARDFHKFLLETLVSKNEIILDMKNITTIDASCIQLLISCKKSCVENNKPFQINNLSDELLDIFSILGADLILEV